MSTQRDRNYSFRCAISAKDRAIYSIQDFHEKHDKQFMKKIAETLANMFLQDKRDRKYFEDTFKCWPPSYWFILLVSIIEIICFLYHLMFCVSSIDSLFIYRPDKKYEIWRFFLYMLLHASLAHLILNLIVQIILGIPLEIIHGSGRIACIYLAGVLAGSLGTSIFDSNAFLVGSSGGVYALLAAHLANIMLNYSNMYDIIRLLAILLFASCDVGFAIYSRYENEPSSVIPSVSFVAHVAGAGAGLTIGLIVLKNFEQKLHEQLIWWVALGIYCACIIFAIIFNIMNSGSFDISEEVTKKFLTNKHVF